MIVNKNIIAIIGMMGAGKTVVGARLAQKLGYYFIDSDEEIEDQDKRKINDIFAQSGEKYFREVEEKIILELIRREENMVISLGGGAFINENIRHNLLDKAFTIWLYASIDETVKRLSYSHQRPLLNFSNKRQIIEDLFNKRYPIYQNANIAIDTSNKTIDNIIDNILKLLESGN